MLMNELFNVVAAPIYVRVHPYDDLQGYLSYMIGDTNCQAFTMPDTEEKDTDNVC